MKKGKIYIGTSGYNYSDWKGVFYPKDLPQKRWLEHYQKFFGTVELNVTFYRLPQKAAFKSWDKRTRKDFVFALKGSRFITHIKRLKEPKKSLKIFFEQSSPLKKKAKIILWQLPPSYKINLKRLEIFLKETRKCKVRNAFEFRHESWFCDDVFGLLKKYGATFCFADWPKFNKKAPEDFTYIYVRRHGEILGLLYCRKYTDRELKKDAENIKKWLKEGKDVYVYFNNDRNGYAVENALTLERLTK